MCRRPFPLNLLIVPERAGIAWAQLLADFLTEQIRSIPGIEQGRPPSSPIPRPRAKCMLPNAIAPLSRS
jgi:hypothetical protein